MRRAKTSIVLGLLALAASAATAQQLDLGRYKELYPSLSAAERARYERALAEEARAVAASTPAPLTPVAGDLCTPPTPTPEVLPYNFSGTTVGFANNYDIATNCGNGQTVFAGTGAALDVAYGITTSANCTLTVTGDPTGANWDMAIYVLQAPAAACTQLPALADPQCVGMDDDGGSNVTEVINFAATGGTEYFLVVDGFNAATGTFDISITGTGCTLVPVELQGFTVGD
jgi:hypothetical protein